MCAHAPSAVHVRASDGCTSRGPVEFLPRMQQDDHGGLVEELEQVLTIPAAHLPTTVVESELTLIDNDGAERRMRVHRRRPSAGDGLLHELALVDA